MRGDPMNRIETMADHDLLERSVDTLMTRDPVTVGPTQGLAAARKVMLQTGGHHIPVVENGRLIGLLTPSDLLQSAPRLAYALDPDQFDAALDQVTVRRAMLEDMLTIGPDTKVREACERFATGKFHCLPVVGEGGRLLGLVTTSDVIKALL